MCQKIKDFGLIWYLLRAKLGILQLNSKHFSA